MKASDLIKTLQTIMDLNGDYEVHMKVGSALEAYETYGQDSCTVKTVWFDRYKQQIYLE